MDNQGNNGDELDNLAEQFEKIKCSMSEQQHGANPLPLAGKQWQAYTHCCFLVSRLPEESFWPSIVEQACFNLF